MRGFWGERVCVRERDERTARLRSKRRTRSGASEVRGERGGGAHGEKRRREIDSESQAGRAVTLSSIDPRRSGGGGGGVKIGGEEGGKEAHFAPPTTNPQPLPPSSPPPPPYRSPSGLMTYHCVKNTPSFSSSFSLSLSPLLLPPISRGGKTTHARVVRGYAPSVRPRGYAPREILRREPEPSR